MIFEYKTRVDIGKVNSMALVTNKGMLALLENVACMHSDMAGYGICDIPSTRLSWVQLNWRVAIIRRLKYNEEITIKTWAKEASKVTTIRDFEVLDKDGKQVCIATTKWTLTNIDTQGLAKITDDIIKKYEPVSKSIMPEYEFKKLQEPESFSNEYIYLSNKNNLSHTHRNQVDEMGNKVRVKYADKIIKRYSKSYLETIITYGRLKDKFNTYPLKLKYKVAVFLIYRTSKMLIGLIPIKTYRKNLRNKLCGCCG